MAFRMFLGKSGSKHSEYIISEITNILTESPHGAPIFYIVPDQMTFQQEYKLFNGQALKGSIRTQVSSFSRLAWRVIQETGGGTRKFISSVGAQMVLRKIIEEKDGDWHVFQKALEKQGFLTQLEGMISEFKRHDVTPNMLREQINELGTFVHKTASEAALQSKLKDLSYIYERFTEVLKDKYVDGEDQLDMLVDKIMNTNYFAGAEIYLDGFYRFTPKELRVVEALMLKCKRVTIALIMDSDEVLEARNVSELDLFYQTNDTYAVLEEIVRENEILQEDHIYLDTLPGYFVERPYFAHLEENFDVRPVPEYVQEAPIQIAEAVHPRAEIEGVAQEVLRLVRETDCRFNDIVIFIRDTETYHDLIQTIFEDYRIPVFVDEKRPMLHHALIEFIRSILDVIEENWRYDAVFRVLKTGFIPSSHEEYRLDFEAIDELENYVLEYGIRSRSRWLGEKRWVFQRFRGFNEAAQTDKEKETEAKINAYREQVARVLGPFDEQIRSSDTVEQLCTVIYTLLEQLDIPSQLERLRTLYDEHGALEKGREQEQVWNAVVQLFDEIVEIAGKEKITLPTFRAILEAGFESLEFAHVPPALDQVIVASVDLSRIEQKRHAFLLGVNEGLWPKKPAEDRVMSEEEREMLATQGIQLAETSRRQLLDDWFYMYLSFTKATDSLWISYPLSDEEGRMKIPSQLIKRMMDMFPMRSNNILLEDPDELQDASRFISTKVKTRAALTAQLARRERNYYMEDIWWHVLNWYITNEDKNSTTYDVLQSLYYDNKPATLHKETVEKLYSKKVKASVSRLEMYHRCSYQHFAQYGLGLSERRTYTLDAPDIGQLFHEALKAITEWVHEEHRDFAQLTKDDSKKYANRAVQKLGPVLQHQILHSSKRYEYIQQKLEEIIARAAYVLSEQARLSNFSPIGLEMSFGEGQKLKPLYIQLPNGYELVIRGQIDRVDKSEHNAELYLRIIDYKSSSKKLELVEVYYGLALQMLMYLDVVLSQSEEWLGLKAAPAGVLYFHVHNPFISDDDKPADDLIEDELFKKFKMNGLLLNDQTVIHDMDTSLESGTSKIIPAGLTKAGAFHKSSKVASQDTFKVLQQHIHNLVVEAGIDITTGGVHLNPYQDKQGEACTFCVFSSVCQFDPLIENNQFRKLIQLKDEQILDKIRDGEEE